MVRRPGGRLRAAVRRRAQEPDGRTEERGPAPKSFGGHLALYEAVQAQLDLPLGWVLRSFDRMRRAERARAPAGARGGFRTCSPGSTWMSDAGPARALPGRGGTVDLRNRAFSSRSCSLYRGWLPKSLPEVARPATAWAPTPRFQAPEITVASRPDDSAPVPLRRLTFVPNRSSASRSTTPGRSWR